MFLLLFYSFLAGIVTILSPCILPILPIVLSTTTTTVKSPKKPIGIILGFIFSFTFFTLFLSSIVKLTELPAESLRNFSIIIIFILGLSLVSTKFQLGVEKLFSQLINKLPIIRSTGEGFWSGFVLGLSLGLLWTPCVGPILASVITLAITGQVTFSAFLITFVYSIGTAIPLFIILYTGSSLFVKVPWLLSKTSVLQKLFGFLTIFLAVSMYLGWDRSFQSVVLNTFPKYGANLTKIEEYGFSSLKKEEKSPKLNIIQKAPEIISGGEWFNLPAGEGSSSLKLSELKGKVVLVDFWTYTCINCIRTFPHLKDWHNKYKDNGLVIIGVHSPEFEFEKDYKNVSQAIKDFAIPYPVVQDNNFSTWRAYQNQYWPATYLIDVQGNIRYFHEGEGSYGKTEEAIKTLLKEINPNLETSEVKTETSTNYSRTPETYLGLGRGDYSLQTRFGKDKVMAFRTPKSLSLHQVGFNGDFVVSEEYINPQKGSSLMLKFEAKDVYLVMNATAAATVKVLVDGQPQFFGQDTPGGVVEVNSNRLYHLISLPTPGKHILQLDFEDDKANLFAFTFG